MNLSIEQIAELLAGIARSQQAVIDAIESENGGWRNTHLLPKLNTASNMRLATPRLIDIPSRVLLRSQGRVAMDVATIARALEEAAKGAVPTTTPSPTAQAQTGTGVAAPAAIAAAAVPIAGVAASEDIGNFFDN